jgi:hypothetical protein
MLATLTALGAVGCGVFDGRVADLFPAAVQTEACPGAAQCSPGPFVPCPDGECEPCALGDDCSPSIGSNGPQTPEPTAGPSELEPTEDLEPAEPPLSEPDAASEPEAPSASDAGEPSPPVDESPPLEGPGGAAPPPPPVLDPSVDAGQGPRPPRPPRR